MEISAAAAFGGWSDNAPDSTDSRLKEGLSFDVQMSPDKVLDQGGVGADGTGNDRTEAKAEPGAVDLSRIKSSAGRLVRPLLAWQKL